MLKALRTALYLTVWVPTTLFAQGTLVEVVKPEQHLVRDELVTFGSLRSDESVMIRPEIDGRLAAVHFKEGQAVKAGDLLLSLDDSIARAELAQAQANLNLAQKNYERTQQLFQRGVSNAQARDEAHSQLQVSSASVQLAQARLDKTHLYATHDGVLGLRQASVGEYLKAGDALVNLEVLDPLKVEFRVPQKSAGLISLGQRIELAVDAWPNEPFAGQVYAINPRVDEQGRSQVLRAHVANPDHRLQPGQFVRVAVILAERPNAWLIPEEALVPRGDKLLVAVVVDAKVEFRPVDVGQRKNGMVEIVQGLSGDDTVISAGWQKVSPGDSVRTRETEVRR